MNVETPRIRTAAETGLAESFAAVKARLPAARSAAGHGECCAANGASKCSYSLC